MPVFDFLRDSFGAGIAFGYLLFGEELFIELVIPCSCHSITPTGIIQRRE